MPTIRLETLSYSRLTARDASETDKLVALCNQTGIFHLQMDGLDSSKLARDLEIVDDAQRHFFSQPLAIKMQYATGVPDRGYERFEDPEVDMLEISRLEQLQGTVQLPAELKKVESNLSDLTATSDGILREIFAILSDKVKLETPSAHVVDATRPGKSNLGLAIARAPVGTRLMPAHADDGLLTILYHITPFIEIFDHGTGEWKQIEMVEGAHIVNVGTALQQMSGGHLKANQHQVVQADGDNHLITYYLHADLST